MGNTNLEISYATLRNWQKLNVTKQQEKLTKRANKIYSTKSIIPKEYFLNLLNISNVQIIINELLLLKIDTETIIKNLCINLLVSKNLILYENGSLHFLKNNAKELISSFNVVLNKKLLNIFLPKDEIDILGIIYQCLMTEGDKNKRGSYYTPQNIIQSLTKDIVVKKNQKILDPCCGTGSFLLNFNAEPASIYGLDIDPIAVIIAKTNLIIKFSKIEFTPQIYNYDFLTIATDLFSDNDFTDEKFDYIITNPPWGSKSSKNYIKYFTEIKSKEIFSYFIVKSNQLLKKNGVSKFVLPESILNISIHNDIRKYILKNMSLKAIKLLGQCFCNVVSKVVALTFDGKYKDDIIEIESSQEKYYIDKKNFTENFDYVFILSDCNKLKVIKKIYTLPYLTLANSTWGLGIVTGDNKHKLFTKKDNESRSILTGKEVLPYRCNEAQYYFNFNKKNLQQTAKEEIYFAREKLIYKFISSRLVFAYDNRQRCVLNSANILIPKISCMNIKTVMAYLNSDVMQFVYKETFNQIKVLKNNLCKLPFPYIPDETNKKLEELVNQKLNGVDTGNKIQSIIYNSYNLTHDDIKIIKGEKNENTN